MLALLLGFVAVARRLQLADRASLGYGVPRREFVREMALGLILGVVTMLALVALMSALGLLDWSRAAAFSVARAGEADRAARGERFRGGIHRGDLPARRHAYRDRARVGHAPRRCCAPRCCMRPRTSSRASTSRRSRSARTAVSRCSRARCSASLTPPLSPTRSSRCAPWAWCSAWCARLPATSPRASDCTPAGCG